MMEYEYINSEIEWLSTVPKHWKVDRIKDKTTDVIGGDWGSDPESEMEGENVVVLRVADLDGIYFNFDELTIRRIKDESFNSRKVTDRCLLIEKSGGGEKQLVGRTGFPLGIDFDAICSNFMAKIDFDNTVDLKFANYIFSSLYSSNLNLPFVQQTTGIQNLNVTYYLNSKVPFPPLPEQKAIADYLDKACHRIDKIIEIKERQLERIKTVRKSKIDELVCFGVDSNYKVKETGLSYMPKINKEWKIDRFKDVAKLRNEKTDEKSDENDYIELEDIEQGTGHLIGKRNTLEVESKVTKFYKGDVLFGKLRPYLEKYHFAEFDGKCTGEILAFEPCRINGEFLKYLIASKWFIDLCNSMAYGAKMPRVNWNTQLAMVYFPLPSKEEQVKIVAQLNNLSNKVHLLNNKINGQITTLQSYRKSLIHECVTGKKQVWEGEIEKVK